MIGDTFDAIFFTFLITTVCALLLALAKMCYKSKCTNIKCCGIEIQRDVITEEKEDTLHIPTIINVASQILNVFYSIFVQKKTDF